MVIRDIFEAEFNGTGGIEQYRSWVFPDLHPNEKPARLENWPNQDIEMYCGTRELNTHC
ncbi:hypothetical protein [Nocardia sp. IFM 10818]